MIRKRRFKYNEHFYSPCMMSIQENYETLEKLGIEGWELVSVFVRVIDGREHVRYFFKMEIL